MTFRCVGPVAGIALSTAFPRTHLLTLNKINMILLLSKHPALSKALYMEKDKICILMAVQFPVLLSIIFLYFQA